MLDLFFILKPVDFIIQSLFHFIFFFFFFKFEYQVFEYFKNFKFLPAKRYRFISLLQKIFLRFVQIKENV